MEGKNHKQILLLLLRPFLANMSRETTSNALLAKQIISIISLCYNNAQNHNQYVPLSVACIKELYCFFLKKQDRYTYTRLTNKRLQPPQKLFYVLGIFYHSSKEVIVSSRYEWSLSNQRVHMCCTFFREEDETNGFNI